MAWKKVLQEGAVAASDISSGSISTTYTDANNYTNANAVSAVNAESSITATCDSPNITQTTVSGNAGTATILATSRNIAGNSFNGSSAITISIEDLDNVTVDDAAAGGSPSTGDIWIEY
jgi:orotate phosphoribosyltransferase